MLHLDQALLHLFDRSGLHGLLSFYPKLLLKDKDFLELVLKLLAETIDHGRFHFELIKGRGLLKRDREVFAGRRATTSVEVTVMTAR